MTLDVDEFDLVKEEIVKLPHLYRLAFAASCCERLLPTYYAFSRAENFGNPSLLREGLNEVWNVVLGNSVNPEQIERLRENCLKAIPPEDRVPESGYNDQAQLAVIAIYDTLEACFTSNSESISKTLECTRDTVTEHIRILKDIEDIEWSEKKSYEEQRQEIANHPFVIREIAKQREDLQRLKEAETLDRELLEWLRTSYNNDRKSLIDLS